MFIRCFLIFNVFCILFAFRLPLVYNSVVFSLVLMFVACLPRVLVSKRLLITRPIKDVVIVYSLLSLIVLIYALSSLSFDFSRLDSVLSNIFSFISVVLFYYFYNSAYGYTKSSKDTFDDICEIIFIVMLIQSLIIIFAMFSSKFLGFVQLFQSPSDAERAQSYGGIRGLSLSAAQFFPMSALFAVSQIFIVKYILRKNSTYINWFFYFLIVVAGLSSGRTSIVGTFIALTYIVLNLRMSLYGFLKFIKYIVITLFLLAFVFRYLESSIPNFYELLEKYTNFAFEFFVNYQNSGSFSTSSTNILQRMYWMPSIHTLLLGDGFYQNFVGGTYMGTDGGFMRNVLFFGILGTTIIISLFLYLVRWIFINSFRDYSLFGLLLILISFLHYKGDVLLHLVSVQTLLLFFIIIPYRKMLKNEKVYNSFT